MLKVIQAGRLVDGQGGPPKEHMAVVVEGGRILRVCSQQELSMSIEGTYEFHDFPQGTLLPGLVDCHTHTNMPGTGLSVDEVGEEEDDIHLLQGVKNARMALESGVTTMRDNGGWHRAVFSLKEGIRRHLVQGPRIVASGRPVTMTGGHCWMMGSQADGIDGVRTAVRQLVHEGADFIKVMASGGSTRGTMPERPSYTLEEMKAIVDEAHLRGRLVAAHAHAVQSIINCLDSDVDMIIHCTFVRPDGTSQFEPRLGERIAASGAWVNPTLHVIRDGVARLERKRLEGGLTPQEEQTLDAERHKYEARLEVCRQLIATGARMIGGTDCGWGTYAFGRFHDELNDMVEAGLSTSQALLASTRDAADALGLLDQIGTLEAGKEADLLVVDGDPTQDINHLASTVAVFKDGAKVPLPQR